jgi:NitT/TauT family transport system substrate-binding protein
VASADLAVAAAREGSDCSRGAWAPGVAGLDRSLKRRLAILAGETASGFLCSLRAILRCDDVTNHFEAWCGLDPERRAINPSQRKRRETKMDEFCRFGVKQALVVIALVLGGGISAQAQQPPRANGETLNIQTYAGATGNMHAIVASAEGFCEKYNFKCELKTLNSSALGVQGLIGNVVDVAMGAPIQAITADAMGADVVLVGVSITNSVLAVSVRNDVPMPSRNEGYPALMKDFKGKKIGFAARGTEAELLFDAMLREGGLQPSDVTAIGVGGPATAYTSLVISKQVDATTMFQPMAQLCVFNKTCQPIIDMSKGEGPEAVKHMNGVGTTFSMRREFAEKNPKLVAAFYAAMRDAAEWVRNPANFEDLVKIYKPLVSFGDMPNGDALLREWLKEETTAYSEDLAIKRSSVQATIDFYTAAKTLPAGMKAETVIWDKAPIKPES